MLLILPNWLCHIPTGSYRLMIVREIAAPAIDEFVRANARSLFGTAYVLTGNANEAEDLVQDTLVALMPKWAMVSSARNPLAYVRRALVHRHLDRRRAASAKTILMDQAPDEPDPIDLAQTVSGRDAIARMLAQLPARARAAVVLKYLYDLPDTAIADTIGCRVATVRSLTRRALITLRAAAETGVVTP